jgi:predicted lipoprotein with Yx(FWY)xxD motif
VKVRNRGTAAVLLLLLGLLTACAEDPASPSADDTPASSSPTETRTDLPSADPSTSRSARPTEAGTEVIAADSDFGRVLFDSSGQAVYLFDVESTTEPRCYGDCADAWPPVLTDGAPVAGEGLTQSLLGTVRRTDGTTQVTYGGHPLYFYAHEGRHEVKCHDIFLNGGTWYAVAPSGDRAP